jgi:Na+/melibiose symporter-like transporter
VARRGCGLRRLLAELGLAAAVATLAALLQAVAAWQLVELLGPEALGPALAFGAVWAVTGVVLVVFLAIAVSEVALREEEEGGEREKEERG